MVSHDELLQNGFTVPSVKAAAKGCIYCWVCWFVCFKMTHSNNFARALRCTYVPED